MIKLFAIMLFIAIILSGCTQPEVSKPVDDTGETTGPIEFGVTFDNFVEASKNCEPATSEYITPPANFFGTLISMTTFMEIQGMENGKCIYFQRIEDVTIAMSDEFRQQMRDQGNTEEKIEQMIQQQDEQSRNSLIGAEKTCKFDTTDLTAMLENWKAGNLSTSDWGNAECEDYFPNIEQ